MDLFIFTKMEIANHINEPRGFVVIFFCEIKINKHEVEQFSLNIISSKKHFYGMSNNFILEKNFAALVSEN